MKLYVTVLRDIVANVWGQPNYSPSIGGTIRAFGDACNGRNGEKDILAQHPEHFELWLLATYDDETAEFTFQDETGTLKKQLAAGANMVVHKH